jgi:uncharacterized membrane protein
MNDTIPATAHAESKRPRTLLAGPYGHPLHPIMVTIPIGAWAASIVFDIVAFASDDPAPFVIGATWLIGIGIVGAVLAAVLGLLDFSKLARGTVAHRVGLIHMVINLAVTVVFAIGLALRIGADGEPHVFAFVLSLVGFAALGVSGWLGGKLAYTYGVRVADEGKQAEGFHGV